ncbi:MAG: JAB domain-containing protein [Candidatus Binatia bacterium]
MVGIDEVATGASRSCLVHPREVLKSAILANASAIIAAHNHPSGDVTPSAADRCVTKRLSEAGNLLGIPFLDHLIVSGTTASHEKERRLLTPGRSPGQISVNEGDRSRTNKALPPLLQLASCRSVQPDRPAPLRRYHPRPWILRRSAMREPRDATRQATCRPRRHLHAGDRLACLTMM